MVLKKKNPMRSSQTWKRILDHHHLSVFVFWTLEGDSDVLFHREGAPESVGIPAGMKAVFVWLFVRQ